jgi:hypothetical protein
MTFSISRSYSLHLIKTIILIPQLSGIGMTDRAKIGEAILLESDQQMQSAA